MNSLTDGVRLSEINRFLLQAAFAHGVYHRDRWSNWNILFIFSGPPAQGMVPPTFKVCFLSTVPPLEVWLTISYMNRKPGRSANKINHRRCLTDIFFKMNKMSLSLPGEQLPVAVTGDRKQALMHYNVGDPLICHYKLDRLSIFKDFSDDVKH